MIRLKTIKISGFRGARYPLVIDLTSSGKSIAIYGENAAGKSTITDAVEWFFKDRIAQLWREDCKADSQRKFNIEEKEATSVSLDFTVKNLASEKILKKRGNSYITEETNKTAEFKTYISHAKDERLDLRTAYLTEFIKKTKGEKRIELANIIGYEAIESFRKVMQSTQSALENDPTYTAAKKILDTAQAKLLQLASKVLRNQQELYTTANEILKPFKIGKSISDEDSYKECIQELKGKVSQREKAEKKLKLEGLRSQCVSLIKTLQDADGSASSFFEPYGRLIESKEKIKLLDLEQFLSKGKELLNKGLAEPSKCPFCGSRVDLDHLRKEVEKRIIELDTIKKEFQSTKSLKDQWINDLRNVWINGKELEKKWVGLEIREELKTLVENIFSIVNSLAKDTEEAFLQYKKISENKEWKETKDKLVAGLEVRVKKADDEIKTLTFTKEEQAILEAIEKLNNLKTIFDDYQQNFKLRDSFERQIKTLDKIKENFTKVQNAAFQNMLDLMSTDISRYYLYLHPPRDEKVDKIRLRIVGEEGIEFEYSFHGKPTYPPMKYLSESHLNSLGIALFLSSVKLINKKSNFFVLDDVVTSFDHGHRLRLLRLLQEEFKDWQIIILTHERFWFEMIRRELGATGWILKEVDCTPENGIQIKGSWTDYREFIMEKKSKDKLVANDIRNLLERLLKEICQSLEVKMAFRYNEHNEERMVGELLSELRRTLNEKNESIKDNPIFSRIETSNFLVTTGSHDRPQDISKGDIEVALEDIDALERLFLCTQCNTLVSRKRFMTAEKKIICKCGELGLDWKGAD